MEICYQEVDRVKRGIQYYENGLRALGRSRARCFALAVGFFCKSASQEGDLAALLF